MFDFQQKVSNVLGEENVVFGESACQYSIKNTLNIKATISGILYPTTTDQVIEVVRLANKYLVQLYPVSTGKNWGYGCQIPTRKNCFIVNLSKLNKIEIINKELGVFSIEPGVTQKMMADFLLENQLSFVIPTTGAGLNCSLIGNALDRGYRLSPITDHFKGLTSIDAILPNGDLYQSPFAAYGCRLLSHLHPNGVGPNIQGLFAQSHLGIVTRASIHLQKKSKDVCVFYFGINDNSKIALWIELIQLAMGEFSGIIQSVNLMNKNRIIATKDSNAYPINKSNKSLFNKMIHKGDRMEWQLIGAIHGNKEITTIVIKKLKKLFSSHSDMKMFFTQRKLKVLKYFLSYIPVIRKNEEIALSLSQMQSFFDLVSGVPSNVGLNLAYLYKKYDKNNLLTLNPSLDDVGLRWFAPLVPIIPEKVLEFNEIITRVSSQFEVPALITFNTISPLCFDCTIPIFFEKDNELSEKKADEYFWALLNECQKAGFFPYRLDIEAQKKLIIKDLAYWQTPLSIKKALDPNNIISPGRYLPDVT